MKCLIGIIAVLLISTSAYAGMGLVGRDTAPEVQTFCKRVLDDGGTVVDIEYMDKTVKLLKQLGIWSNVKFLGDANFAYKSGVTTTVAKLYDLSGNNNDATQATVGNQPVWTANVQNGKYGLVVDGTQEQGFDVANESQFDFTNTFSLVLFYKWDAIVGTVYPSVIKKGPYRATSFYVERNNLELNTAGVDYLISSTLAELEVGLSTFIIDAGTGTPYLNGVEKTPLGSMTCTLNDLPLRIGRYEDGNVNSTFNGTIWTVCVLNTALTTAQRTALETFVNAYYSIY